VALQKLRGIIFDIGRVLIRVNIARAMEGLASASSLSPSDLWSAIQNDPRWHDWQEGRISPRDWHLHLSQRLGVSLRFEEFTEVWNRALDPQPILDVALVEKLSKRYRLALLSNTDPIHVCRMETTYPFFSFFRVRIYSCSIGASKPNPLIYREALSASKLRAEEAVYVDDVRAYAEAAEKLGMKGIVFQSPEQLGLELQGLGVDVS
jgi:glucose-1-phosphatase